MEEIWKDIPGYEGQYMVSEYGKIKRLYFKAIRKNRWGSSHEYTMTPMPIKSHSLDKRYLSVYLSGELHMVHRLVAMVFIPNRENKPFINHKDANGFNNHYSNLEWCTNQENMDHAVKMGRLQHVSAKKLNAEKVREIKLIPRTISSIKVAKQYNVNSRVIRAIRLNQIWKYV